MEGGTDMVHDKVLVLGSPRTPISRVNFVVTYFVPNYSANFVVHYFDRRRPISWAPVSTWNPNRNEIRATIVGCGFAALSSCKLRFFHSSCQGGSGAINGARTASP